MNERQHEPSPEEQARLLAEMPADLAVVHRLVTAMRAKPKDNAAWQHELDALRHGDDALFVLAASVGLVNHLLTELTEHLGGDPQTWLDAALLDMLDAVEKRRNDQDE